MYILYKETCPTAPTGSAAFQIGGSTIHPAFLLHDNLKSKPNWEKRTQMQLKLEHMMLSITNEIGMVAFKQFQSRIKLCVH